MVGEKNKATMKIERDGDKARLSKIGAKARVRDSDTLYFYHVIPDSLYVLHVVQCSYLEYVSDPSQPCMQWMHDVLPVYIRYDS